MSTVRYPKPLECVVHCPKGCDHRGRVFGRDEDGSYVVQLYGPGQKVQTIVGKDVEVTDPTAWS